MHERAVNVRGIGVMHMARSEANTVMPQTPVCAAIPKRGEGLVQKGMRRVSAFVGDSELAYSPIRIQGTAAGARGVRQRHDQEGWISEFRDESCESRRSESWKRIDSRQTCHLFTGFHFNFLCTPFYRPVSYRFISAVSSFYFDFSSFTSNICLIVQVRSSKQELKKRIRFLDYQSVKLVLEFIFRTGFVCPPLRVSLYPEDEVINRVISYPANL